MLVAVRVDDSPESRTGICSQYNVSSCGDYLVRPLKFLVVQQCIL